MSSSSSSSRERERNACDVIDITLKLRVIMGMITSTACRPYASTRFLVESLSGCVKLLVFTVKIRKRSLALERSSSRVE